MGRGSKSWVRRVAGGLLIIASLSGCRSTARQTTWCPPVPVEPQPVGLALGRFASPLTRAESEYALGLQLEQQDDPSCVDHFYRAATLIWPDVERNIRRQRPGRADELYRSSLQRLLATGMRFQRFDPRQGLRVRSPTGWCEVPTVYHGFRWRPADFNQLVLVGDYSTERLNRIYSVGGLGVATVVVHYRGPSEPFHRERQAFSATVLLRPQDEAFDTRQAFVMELFDPLRLSDLEIQGRQTVLRRDLSAPIAYRALSEGPARIEAFLQPGSTTENIGLFFTEPFDPCKIPIVLIHGLLSDPFTWANVVNELRACPDLVERYQVWGFEYATGEPFLRSAAKLRIQLAQALSLAPDAGALNDTVLVGHSMGGLVAKLQVTSSGNALWDAVASCPLNQLVTSPITRQRLAQAFYFEPSPQVTEVVYMATPHRGSPWADRVVGRAAASLVEEPSSMAEEHEQLMCDNPGVFSAEFSRRIPTSVDLLSPESVLLRTMDRLPIAPYVQQHSVIGCYRLMVGAGDSDGVVPVESARHPGDLSEVLVPAKHTEVHQCPEGIEELIRVLRQHLREVDVRR